MNVALYLRRSTNERLQADSLRVQEQVLRAYAKQHGMRIVAIYRDSASGTSTKHRKAFLRMVETITHGAPFEAVLVRDVARFGRFYDMDEAAFFEVLFLGHRVKTIYCEEAFTDDTTPMAGLIKSVRRVMAAEYSRDKARMIRYAQARATRLGFHVTGAAPYGLRRVMVKPSGDFVRDLGPGEWKALSNHRTILLPGPVGQIAMVQRIFRQYACDGLTVAQIVDRLNADRISSPQGCWWNARTVAAILRNPRYVGVSQYCPTEPLPTFAGVDGVVQGLFAGASVIEQTMWDRVRQRLGSSVRHMSNDEIAAELRDAYERHGCIEQRMLVELPHRISWFTIRNRFKHGVDGALAGAYARQIEESRTQLAELLRTRFGARQEQDGWAIDGGLTVAFRPAFLHRSRWGIHWCLRAGSIRHDVVISCGIRPDGTPTEFFVMKASEVRSDAPGLRKIERYAVSQAQLLDRLSFLRRAGVPGVERGFLEAARAQGIVNLTRLARELCWPAQSVRSTYWRLIARGEWLPPLRNGCRRRVERICTDCGNSRWETVTHALQRKTDRCRRCTARRPIRKVLLRCPTCGREDARWPSAVRKLSGGPQTLCRRCCLQFRSR